MSLEKESYYVHSTAVIDQGSKIGAGSKIWHFCHVMESAEIGENCVLGQNVFVGRNVVLGNQVKVQNNVSLFTGLICADDVFIGPSAVFTNVYNPRSRIERKHEFRPTYIGRGATIGANATIVCGNDIGAYAFIGAGTVVIRPVPSYALVVGNPGRQIGWMSEYGNRLFFDEHGVAKCAASGEEYELSNGEVRKLNP